VSLEGATSVPVTNMQDFHSVLEKGLQHRTTKSTKMNDVSSRSHCILTITIVQTHVLTKKVKESKINLIDLAGSERGKKSGHLTRELKEEAVAINLSLTALNSCFLALTKGKSKYIPYRQSLLTWILQDSLGGNAKTILISTISPAADNTHETLSTLRYSSLAKAMPNDLKTIFDDAELRREANLMRNEEISARQHLITYYNFSEAHLDLLSEYYTCRGDKIFRDGELLTSSWKIQQEKWDRFVHDCCQAEINSKRIAGWIRKFSAVCTDASEQRYLKVYPNESIEMSLLYSCENIENGWIQQLQITIDYQRPVCNIAQVCGDRYRNQEGQYRISAPSEEGLYLLWWRGDLQYSLKDAENNYPKSYHDCDSWYHGFIAWVRVDSRAQPKPPGPPACYLPKDYQSPS
jgi:hypothetical protein